MRQAWRPLAVWLENDSALGDKPAAHVQDSLLDATGKAHPSTIRAAVARDGDWHRLSYGHHLSHGARRMAAQLLEPKISGFRDIARNVLLRDELIQGHHLVRQAQRAIEEGFDGLVRKVQLVGQSVYSDDLMTDADFWRTCAQERGDGYRNKINQHNAEWFEADTGDDADKRVVSLISEEWSKTIDRIKELMPA